ncbi:hypothetical protein RIR_jg17671.t1 [Rhizophagus irregularis DAOM 181602=DAOM 197198]|uniref:Uncharacterized protein n=1 Tax=Rhizophagus irregularis (strain DAOM 181602 / DAOM 197198 / MUCL 43194) TaxID=747089 RepID=U9SSA5_RHIID|nr:hypothetical protein RIR_jg17671.t1 [Rhizophagus irregularis DAOM 181602=DAOM 197198]
MTRLYQIYVTKLVKSYGVRMENYNCGRCHMSQCPFSGIILKFIKEDVILDVSDVSMYSRCHNVSLLLIDTLSQIQSTL